MTAKIDFEAKQGATFRRLMTYRDSSNALVDLTGYTARMQVRSSYEGPVVIELTTENDRVNLGGAAGTIELLISAVDMAAIPVSGGSGTPPFKEYVYDLELVQGAEVLAFAEGTFAVKREVTRL